MTFPSTSLCPLSAHNTDEIKTVKSIKFSKEYGKQQLFPQQEKIEPLISLIRISRGYKFLLSFLVTFAILNHAAEMQQWYPSNLNGYIQSLDWTGLLDSLQN